jgi:predicted DNA-binding transcriptional regulator AlpA
MRPKLQAIGPANSSSSSSACNSGSAATTIPTRILRVKEVVRRTGVSRTTIWRLERRSEFPARRQISPGAVGWIESEVERWISCRVTKAVRNLE